MISVSSVVNFSLKAEVEGFADVVGGEADEAGTGEGEDPGEAEVAEHFPGDGFAAFGCADAGDRACNHVGGADGHAEEAGGEDDEGGGAFCGKALDRFDFGDGKGHGFDDAEAAGCGAEAHDEGAGKDDPKGDCGGGEVAAGKEAEGDDTHAFLCVVESVGEGDKAG